MTGESTIQENIRKNGANKVGKISADQNVYSLGNSILHTKVLRLIKDYQQQHGLKHGDYQRYRGYCSRRIRRLRKTLKMTQGDKRHFKRCDVTISHLTAQSADEKLIHIPLLLSERAWAYAMQLRQEANTEIRKKFHLISKLRKACAYALKLQELCSTEVFDARTKLEANAYVAWMHGTLQFELSLWKNAAESFKKAQLIYENLAQALPEDERDLFKEKIDELTPSLRYCSYNIGGETSVDELLNLKAKGLLKNMDVLVAQTRTKNNETLQTIEWRGRKITFRSEKVSLFLLSIKEIDKSLEKVENLGEKIQLIENILMDCKDTISAVKDEIKQDPKLRTSTTGQVSSNVQNLLGYLTYIRLTRTIERNLYLIAQAKISLDDPNQKTKTFEGKRVKPQDLTRFYEIIIQNISEIQQINGMENDLQFQSEMEDLSTSFKAFRCYYIALTLVELKRWKEAVAMYERSTRYAMAGIQTNQTQFNIAEELKKLIKTIESCKFSAHAYSVLEYIPSNDSVSSMKLQKINKPLCERLSVYKDDPQLLPKNPNVFKITPEIKPIPCKASFFDLALNYVEFPSLDNKIESASGNKAAGISGFVKGFLGWSNKSDN